jgi:hypothetical protein
MLVTDSVTPDRGQTCPLIRGAATRYNATKFQTFD